jgi:uncharacterized protein (DUF1501 family)
LGHIARFTATGQTTGQYRALVCVFLYGGNDASNTFLPNSGPAYTAYLAARGPLALQQSQLLPVSTLSGQSFGFNASAPEFANLFNSRKLAAVVNVGTLIKPITKDEYVRSAAPVPLNLFSHSDQQLQWQNVNFSTGYSTGWGGRAVERLASYNSNKRIPAILSVAGSQLFCVGQSPEMAATLVPGVEPGLSGATTTNPGMVERLQAFKNLLALDSGAALVQRAAATTSEGVRQAEVLKAVLANQPPLHTPFPATELGGQLKQVADVIRVRQELGINRQIFFCSMGGFDTHKGLTAQHGQLLAEVSAAVKSFYDATMELGVDQQVTTFTHSEFGRTLQPTTSLGSDHAWGGHHFVIGGAVKGGEVYGKYPLLELGGPDDATGRGALIPTTSVDQYVATLATWLGVPQAQIGTMLPNLANFATKNLGFII